MHHQYNFLIIWTFSLCKKMVVQAIWSFNVNTSTWVHPIARLETRSYNCWVLGAAIEISNQISPNLSCPHSPCVLIERRSLYLRLQASSWYRRILIAVKFSPLASVYIPSSMLFKANANHYFKACKHNKCHYRQKENPKESPQ